MKKYPDIREIVEKKAAHRRSLAGLSFEQKIEIVFKLRERRKFIKSGRTAGSSQTPKNEALLTSVIAGRLVVLKGSITALWSELIRPSPNTDKA